jgi:hypothetical protein
MYSGSECFRAQFTPFSPVDARTTFKNIGLRAPVFAFIKGYPPFPKSEGFEVVRIRSVFLIIAVSSVSLINF